MLRVLLRNITDIVLYLALFGLTYYFFNRSICNNFKAPKRLYFVIAVLVLCIYAAIRPSTIGTDVAVYSEKVFQFAQNSTSMADMILAYPAIEWGYLFIAYCIASIGFPIGFFHFTISLLTVVPVFFVITKTQKENEYVNLGLLFFLFILYGMSLNVMRQSIGAAWLLLSFYYFNVERKKVPAILAAVVAYLFHSSAILGIAVIAVAGVLGNIKNAIVRYFLVIFSAICAVLVVTNLYNIINWLVSIGVLSHHYEYYLNVLYGTAASGEYMVTLSASSYADFLIRVIIVGLAIYLCKSNKTKTTQQLFYSQLIFTVIYMFLFFTYDTMYAYRIAMYGDYLLVLYYNLCDTQSMYEVKLTDHRIYSGRVFAVTLCFAFCFAMKYIYFGMHDINKIIEKFF